MKIQRFSRRQSIKTLGLVSLGLAIAPTFSFNFQDSMRTREIPSSSEKLPVVGLGTWIQFDVGASDQIRAPLLEVLKTMHKKGGKVIDSSPMYGNSERVVGDLTSGLTFGSEYFFATKVWTSGKESGVKQMTASMQRMRRQTMDLMQIHNLLDWKIHLRILQGWRESGKIRYLGVTHYTESSHSYLEQIIKTENIDFVQFNYSIRSRNAERSLLETAKDNNVAVIINRPYDGGSLFSKIRVKKIPTWANELDIKSWGQFFLKFILSHPAVTCVIPGTSKPLHALDNMMAGFGRLPDQKEREKMAKFVERL